MPPTIKRITVTSPQTARFSQMMLSSGTSEIPNFVIAKPFATRADETAGMK